MSVQLHLGDCLEVMRSMPDKFVDAVITDIPYGEVNRESNGLRNLDKGSADIETFELSEFMEEVVRITNGSIYIFCGTEQISFIRKYMVEKGMSTRAIVWEKTNPSPMNGEHIWLSGVELCVYGKHPNATFNEFCKNTVFRTNSVKSKLHPTQKPEELVKKFIYASTNEGNIVMDMCMGSGTTGVACVQTGRNFIGIEIDPTYFAIAERRIQEAQLQLRLPLEAESERFTVHSDIERQDDKSPNDTQTQTIVYGKEREE